MFNGILPIYKEKDYTSHDVVAKLRGILRMKKIGHTGTLDPAVTGVLPICLGQGTKVAEYLLDLPKTYEGRLTLGISTTTEDAEGDILASTKVSPLSKMDIEEAFTCFQGEISQIPPMFSAVKVEGKRLYELARQGKEIDRQARTVTIYSLDILNTNLKCDNPTIDFRVRCSKGTYIRTLCVDIGAKLGLPAHMAHLMRTESGPFEINQAITLDQVKLAVQNGTINEHIYDMKIGVSHLPAIYVDGEMSKKTLFGQPLPATNLVDKCDDGALIGVYDERNGQLLAIHRYEEQAQRTKPTKVFS